VLHVGPTISRLSPRVLQSMRRRSQKRKTNEEDNPAVGTGGSHLTPRTPSPDRLNALSLTPPLEMAGPPLHLQPRRRLCPPRYIPIQCRGVAHSQAAAPLSVRTCCWAAGTPKGRCRTVQPSTLLQGDPAPPLRCAGYAPPAVTAPRVNRNRHTRDTRLKIRCKLLPIKDQTSPI
jgi:hypothetical protein